MSEISKMQAIVSGAPSKSEKMRRLADAGYSIKDIRKFLGVRYAFVRNVLLEHEKKRGPVQTGFTEAGQGWRSDVSPVELFAAVRVAADGSALIPAFVLAEAGLRPGDSFVPDVAGEGDIRLLAGAAALRRAQELVRQSNRGKASLVDEILQQRRRDAQNFAQASEKRRG